METILVADDEAQVRSLARDILRGAGYRVLETEDGEQALRVAEDHQGTIHVLLTDIMMPGINGSVPPLTGMEPGDARQRRIEFAAV